MCKCKKCGNKYRADSKNGTGNLNRHIQSCVKTTTKDIGQFLLSSNQASFSIGGRILDQYRSTLTPQIVESVICSRDWLFGDSGLQTKEKEAMDAIVEEVISLTQWWRRGNGK
ncbi:putative transcription factor/ chromatin remodeling BED-type(Zn) family [Helianthus annuus]|uniref:Transcription factor/ chromatin remodeling BED-type(Zn) family n=1 Tax=Helianthus annuus TaxID=4232 RepID=A0A9K3I3P2_HELAN|nr:putative transcription factor/ chromatin remodeling BED-type(Zn) family [Helianthus annuus]KAJ0891571.1 putative transcription factor/ chromatin remodeling BED-type(Zn) family [Helianthus annuus]